MFHYQNFSVTFEVCFEITKIVKFNSKRRRGEKRPALYLINSGT
jgi:hypothetical protein